MTASGAVNIVSGTPFYGVTLNSGSPASLFVAGPDYTAMFNTGAILTVLGGSPNGGYQKVTSSSYSIGDPDFSSVSLLMNFDESQGSTTFLDLSSVGNTFTNVGSSIDDTNPKFGIGDLYTGTNVDYIFTPTSSSVMTGSPLDLTTGDFTVEGWVYLYDVTQASIFMSLSDLSTQGWLIRINGGAFFATIVQGGFQQIYSATTPVNNTWYHFAFVRQGNNFGLAINGIFGTTFTGSGSLGTVNNQLKIGAMNLGGTIDEVRITKGIARYTPGTNFSPPTAAFPTESVDGTTVSLTPYSIGTAYPGPSSFTPG